MMRVIMNDRCLLAQIAKDMASHWEDTAAFEAMPARYGDALRVEYGPEVDADDLLNTAMSEAAMRVHWNEVRAGLTR